jgi:hypothetical protein
MSPFPARVTHRPATSEMPRSSAVSGRCLTSTSCSARLEVAGNTLASYPYVVVRLGCSRCSREGPYRLERLAAKYGADVEMRKLLEYLASDCAMWGRQLHPVKEQCRPFFVDTDSPKPPEIPAGMRKSKVVR